MFSSIGTTAVLLQVIMARERNCGKAGDDNREKECPINLHVAIMVKITQASDKV